MPSAATDWATLLADPGSVSAVPARADGDTIDGVRCRIGGHEAVLVWCRFDVAAGTLSRAAADRFVELADAATAAGLPLVAVANSGGVRMQEGPRAFVRMVDLVAAVRRHRDAGLPVVTYLADPTTGGILASWGSLGHVCAAEPGATIGFTGPRVAEGLGSPIEPADVQRAEGLHARGLVDAVVSRSELRDWLADVLAALAPPTALATPTALAPHTAPFRARGTGAGTVPRARNDGGAGPTGWAAVAATRAPGRPRVVDGVLAALAEEGPIVEVRGDRIGGRDGAMVTAFARLGGRRILLVAHRGRGGRPARPTAATLRSARRAMELADELGVAVVTLIDTPGPVIDAEQEAQGMAGEVARSLDTMGRLRVPSVAVLAGQGGGGPALAWFAARSRFAVPDAWLAPISPEAGSLIVHRDTAHAAEIAELQQVSATELARDGVVDRVIDPDDLLDAVAAAIEAQR